MAVWEAAVCDQSALVASVYIQPLCPIIISSRPQEDISTGPQFMCVAIPSQSSEIEVPLITWEESDDLAHPVLWALPTVDFDDALGLTNCYSEITIYDHSGTHPEFFGTLGSDPGQTDFCPSGNQPDHSVISQWSQDGLELDEPWRTNWFDNQQNKGFKFQYTAGWSLEAILEISQDRLHGYKCIQRVGIPQMFQLSPLNP
ncbi:hypothetical protein B0H17DRAFT_1126759 [Mycena rosella]|uniref:Uncharacterized protein n=1 Tax=Mycena rosella TaxID=1033263 RepID=A0AAD7GSM2_MYCRO|nr:hypothetical protein B0H17DRAFT_1126759 [Mycena rosella]